MFYEKIFKATREKLLRRMEENGLPRLSIEQACIVNQENGDRPGWLIVPVQLSVMGA